MCYFKRCEIELIVIVFIVMILGLYTVKDFLSGRTGSLIIIIVIDSSNTAAVAAAVGTDCSNQAE